MDRVSKVPAPQRIRVRVAWTLMALVAVGTALFSTVPYLTFAPGASRIPLNPAFPWHIVGLALHAIPGGLSLLLGPFQFIPAIRERYPAAHRLVGRVYLACILVGTAMAVYAAAVSLSGLVAQIGFLMLATAWFASGLMAYLTIRRGQVAQHRVWMIRNYSFTFAVVLLRVFLAAGIAYQETNPALPFAEVYTASVWSSFFVSYVVAEWLIVRRMSPASVPRAARVGRAVA